MATPINPGEVQDFDQPLNTDPMYSVTHIFSTADISVTFDGDTVGSIADPLTVFDTTGASGTKTDGSTTLYPIDSEFGFNVTDFDGAIQKELDGDYAEGWAGDLQINGEQAGIIISDAPTDTFKTPAKLGTWLAGLGGNSVKASTEHYVVMQEILSDQKYPGDPDAVYPLDDDLVVVGGTYDGQLVADVIPLVGDVNGDGVMDIKDVLAPNEASVKGDIAVSDDYSVTLKDDGKLLYRWGNMIKKPNDVRLEVEMPLPDEWKEASSDDPDLMPLFRVTSAELVTHHTITNNPNDQIRPEDYENESAIGTLPTYEIITDYNLDGQGPREVWVTTDPYYAGDGTLYEAGTILRDDLLAQNWAASTLGQLGAEDGAAGFTNAWYTTMDREPFEPVLNEDGTEYETGPRWRLKPNKYGQDLPGVEIPDDPSQPPPPTRDEIKYETGAETQTVINLLDWGFPVSPLSISAGWMNNAGTVSGNGLNMTSNFDVAFYVKGDIKPATLYSTELVMDYEEIEIFDAGVAITGGIGDDYLVGQGGNDFIGDAGNDFFVLAYGADTFAASTIADFTFGEDVIGLINHGVDDTNFDTLITQTVVGSDLSISLDGSVIASLTGVTEELDITDFMLINTPAPSAPDGVIIGTDGDDNLVGDVDANEIWGLAGNDTIRGLGGADTILGGEDDDLLIGGVGNDDMDGNGGNDTLLGQVGNDMLNGGDGNDILNGGDGDDILYDDGGSNRLIGELGNDLINATASTGNNVMFGGGGNDSMYDGIGQAAMFGGAGADRMVGGGGNDSLYGDEGNDVLNGGSGGDRIRGDAGNDYLVGGLGTDLFIFLAGHEADRIADFTNDVDTLFIESTLTGGDTDVASVISTFASETGSDVVFDFGGGNTITILGLTSSADLLDDMIIA